MKLNKKIISMFLMSAFIVVMLTLYTILIAGGIYIQLDNKRVIDEDTKRKIDLIYSCDHEKLLKACQKVLKEIELGQWQKSHTYYGDELDSHIDKLPDEIVILHPYSIHMVKGIMSIDVVHDDYTTFGIRAFSEDCNTPEGYKFSDKELIKNLWYYDDGYFDDPYYDKVIESYRPKSE